MKTPNTVECGHQELTAAAFQGLCPFSCDTRDPWTPVFHIFSCATLVFSEDLYYSISAGGRSQAYCWHVCQESYGPFRLLPPLVKVLISTGAWPSTSLGVVCSNCLCETATNSSLCFQRSEVERVGKWINYCSLLSALPQCHIAWGGGHCLDVLGLQVWASPWKAVERFEFISLNYKSSLSS